MTPEKLNTRIKVLAAGDASRELRLRRLLHVPTGRSWEMMGPHSCVDGRVLTSENVRVLYLHLVDKLIQAIHAEKIDKVVFLDKSARPVAWVTRLAWDVLGFRFVEPGRIERLPAPEMNFVNIDRLQWRSPHQEVGIGGWSVDQIPQEAIEGLRRCFTEYPDSRLAGGRTWFDQRRVLVVDEVGVSGDTAWMAVDILSRAFPDTNFLPYWWMRPRTVQGPDGNSRNNLLPVWYRHDPLNAEFNERGRGVADRNVIASQQSVNKRVQDGRFFLSRPHPPGEVDEGARTLREEFRAAVARVVRGDDLFVPDFNRDDFDQVSQLFNNCSGHDLRTQREAGGIWLDI